MKLGKLRQCVEARTLQRIKEFNTNLESSDKQNPFSSFLTAKLQAQDTENNVPAFENTIQEEEHSKIPKILQENSKQLKETIEAVGGTLIGGNNERGGGGGWGLLQDPQPSEWIGNYEEEGDNEEGKGANTPGFTSQHLSPSSRRKDSFALVERQAVLAPVALSSTAAVASAIIPPDFFTRSQMLFQSSPVFNSIQQNICNNQLVCRKTFRLEDDLEEEEETNRRNSAAGGGGVVRGNQEKQQKEQQQQSQSQEQLEYISNSKDKMIGSKANEGLVTACSSERSIQQQSNQIVQFQAVQEFQQPQKHSENQVRKGSFCPVKPKQQQQEQYEERSEYDELTTPQPATATNSWTMFMDSPFSFPQPELQRVHSNSITSSSVLINPQEVSFKAIGKNLQRLSRTLEKINATLNPRKYILNSQLSNCQKCVAQCFSKLKSLPACTFLRSSLQITLFQIFSQKFKISSGEKQRDIAWECQKNYSKGFSHLEDGYKDACQDIPRTDAISDILSDLYQFAKKMALPADYAQLMVFVKQLSHITRILAPIRSHTSITFTNPNKSEPLQIFRQPNEAHNKPSCFSSLLLSSHLPISSSDTISQHKQEPFSEQNLIVENNRSISMGLG